jgi:hypothetical protein
MSIQTKTALAIILRQLNQGILTRSEAYQAICDMYVRVGRAGYGS